MTVKEFKSSIEKIGFRKIKDLFYGYNDFYVNFSPISYDDNICIAYSCNGNYAQASVRASDIRDFCVEEGKQEIVISFYVGNALFLYTIKR